MHESEQSAHHHHDEEEDYAPYEAYGHLGDHHRSSLAQEFIGRFAGVDDPRAQHYAQMDPHHVSADELGEMHRYAEHDHPGVMGKVMEHPILTGILAAFAVHKAHKERDRRMGYR
ncbi:MAG: hypothetical protein IVW57_18215 [Ktedonobacterales bacterium]|nr:hypothetical protein [Ktedonobacterales bacterium]